MNKKIVFCIVLSVFLAITLISASSYNLEYTQVGNKLVVKETLDGNQISNQVSDDILETGASGYYLIKKLVFNQSYSNVEIKLNLDTGFILEKDGVFPVEYEIQSDGQVISVVWKLNNVESGYVFPMFVKLEDKNPDYNMLLLSLIIVLFGAITYLFLKKKNAKRVVKKVGKTKKKYNENLDYLLDTEKKVVELLKNADRHELWQKQIQNSTNFSKAKVSRLIRNLESRGLIVKIPFGNTNKVRLK